MLPRHLPYKRYELGPDTLAKRAVCICSSMADDKGGNSAAACYYATPYAFAWRRGRAHTYAVKASVETVDCPEIGHADHKESIPSSGTPAGQRGIDGKCGQHEMQLGVYRALRQSATLATPSSILRRGVTAGPCARTHASFSQASHDSFGNVERLLERDWMLQRPDTIVCSSYSGDFLRHLQSHGT